LGDFVGSQLAASEESADESITDVSDESLAAESAVSAVAESVCVLSEASVDASLSVGLQSEASALAEESVEESMGVWASGGSCSPVEAPVFEVSSVKFSLHPISALLATVAMANRTVKRRMVPPV
jgi:hypothetical protein